MELDNAVLIGPRPEIYIQQGDITEVAVDAIVNPVGKHVGRGGKMARTLLDKAGPGYIREIEQLAISTALAEGDCHVTSGYRLTRSRSIRYIIHVRGLYYNTFDDKVRSFFRKVGASKSSEEILEGIIRHVLAEADRHGTNDESRISSIAFPLLTTGEGKADPEKVAPLVLRTVKDYMTNEAHNIRAVHFVDEDAAKVQRMKDEYSQLQSTNSWQV